MCACACVHVNVGVNLCTRAYVCACACHSIYTAVAVTYMMVLLTAYKIHISDATNAVLESIGGFRLELRGTITVKVRRPTGRRNVLKVS